MGDPRDVDWCKMEGTQKFSKEEEESDEGRKGRSRQLGRGCEPQECSIQRLQEHLKGFDASLPYPEGSHRGKGGDTGDQARGSGPSRAQERGRCGHQVLDGTV